MNHGWRGGFRLFLSRLGIIETKVQYYEEQQERNCFHSLHGFHPDFWNINLPGCDSPITCQKPKNTWARLCPKSYGWNRVQWKHPCKTASRFFEFILQHKSYTVQDKWVNNCGSKRRLEMIAAKWLNRKLDYGSRDCKDWVFSNRLFNNLNGRLYFFRNFSLPPAGASGGQIPMTSARRGEQHPK